MPVHQGSWLVPQHCMHVGSAALHPALPLTAATLLPAHPCLQALAAKQAQAERQAKAEAAAAAAEAAGEAPPPRPTGDYEPPEWGGAPDG